MTTFSTTRLGRPAGAAAVLGGLTLVVLGAVAALRVDAGGSDAWFVTAGLAIGLLVVGVLGLRARAIEVTTARRALAATAAAMTVFALAHFYALVNEDLAILLFSVFMILASIGMIVAGVAYLRSGIERGWRRLIPLVCGVWPILTIPAGAAIGDLPHFGAIAVWGLCWTALGTSLLAQPSSRSGAEQGVGALR